MRWRECRVELLLAAVTLLLGLLCIGSVGLFDVDEAIFGEATREMVETRDFVTPTYNYGVRYDKPVLIYWIMAGPEAIFGANSFGARFHSVVAAALTVLLVALFGGAVFGRSAGRWAAVVCASCLHLFLIGRMAFTDMWLTVLMGAAWVALFWAGERRSPQWFLAAAAALGLATLTKGPVALVLPGLTWLLWLLWRYDLPAALEARPYGWLALLVIALLAPKVLGHCPLPKQALAVVAVLGKGPLKLALPGLVGIAWMGTRPGTAATLKALRCGWGWLLYLAILVPWCIAIYLAHGWDFYVSFLGYHNLDRATNTQSGHGGPVFMFVLVVAAGLLPWAGFTLSGAIAAVRRRSRDLAGSAAVYVLLWLVVVIGVFSLSKTKLPNYIAPCYPAAALLAGWALARGIEDGVGGRWWKVWPSLLGMAGLGGGLAAAVWWLPRLSSLQRELGGTVPVAGPGVVVAGVVIALAALAAMVAWCRSDAREAVCVTAAAGLLCGLSVWFGVLPVVDRYQQQAPRAMARRAAAAGADVALLNVHVPSFVFYYHRAVLSWRTGGVQDPRPAMARRLAEPKLLLVVTRDRRVGDALDGLPVYEWMHLYGWRMVGNQPPPG